MCTSVPSLRICSPAVLQLLSKPDTLIMALCYSSWNKEIDRTKLIGCGKTQEGTSLCLKGCFQGEEKLSRGKRSLTHRQPNFEIGAGQKRSWWCMEAAPHRDSYHLSFFWGFYSDFSDLEHPAACCITFKLHFHLFVLLVFSFAFLLFHFFPEESARLKLHVARSWTPRGWTNRWIPKWASLEGCWRLSTKGCPSNRSRHDLDSLSRTLPVVFHVWDESCCAETHLQSLAGCLQFQCETTDWQAVHEASPQRGGGHVAIFFASFPGLLDREFRWTDPTGPRMTQG